MRDNTDIYQDVDIHRIASEGRKIYDTVKEKYAAEKGKFLAIDIESKDVFLGDSNSEVVETAKRKYPDHVFYVVRIGYSAAERLASMAL